MEIMERLMEKEEEIKKLKDKNEKEEDYMMKESGKVDVQGDVDMAS